VLGKFLAAWLLLALMFLLTLPLPLGASALGSFDAGPIASQYVGALLLGAAGLALGLLVSTLSSNQVSAFLIGVALMLGMTLIGRLPAFLPLPAWLLERCGVSLTPLRELSGPADTCERSFLVLITGFRLPPACRNCKG
jgi:hypothetical protein